jgi:hypothetical protein
MLLGGTVRAVTSMVKFKIQVADALNRTGLKAMRARKMV